ncbi:hypothetical protein AAMO2058_001192400 [Amorphochlora amoebiformis]
MAVGLASRSTSTSFLPFLRVFRLTRVFRVFKFGRFSRSIHVVPMVAAQSSHSIFLMAFFFIVAAVCFGSLMYVAEQGTFREDTNQYMRPDKYGTSEERSPFLSIPHAMWWFMVTTSTLGYGDMVPTTEAGKILALGSIYLGIIIIAMPLAIISRNFEVVTHKATTEEKIRVLLEQGQKCDVQIESYVKVLCDQILKIDERLVEIINSDEIKRQQTQKRSLKSRHSRSGLPSALTVQGKSVSSSPVAKSAGCTPRTRSESYGDSRSNIKSSSEKMEIKSPTETKSYSSPSFDSKLSATGLQEQLLDESMIHVVPGSTPKHKTSSKLILNWAKRADEITRDCEILLLYEKPLVAGMKQAIEALCAVGHKKQDKETSMMMRSGGTKALAMDEETSYSQRNRSYMRRKVEIEDKNQCPDRVDSVASNRSAPTTVRRGRTHTRIPSISSGRSCARQSPNKAKIMRNI